MEENIRIAPGGNGAAEGSGTPGALYKNPLIYETI
jgi:hypothetical protein